MHNKPESCREALLSRPKVDKVSTDKCDPTPDDESSRPSTTTAMTSKNDPAMPEETRRAAESIPESILVPSPQQSSVLSVKTSDPEESTSNANAKVRLFEDSADSSASPSDENPNPEDPSDFNRTELPLGKPLAPPPMLVPRSFALKVISASETRKRKTNAASVACHATLYACKKARLENQSMHLPQQQMNPKAFAGSKSSGISSDQRLFLLATALLKDRFATTGPDRRKNALSPPPYVLRGPS